CERLLPLPLREGDGERGRAFSGFGREWRLCTFDPSPHPPPARGGGGGYAPPLTVCPGSPPSAFRSALSSATIEGAARGGRPTAARTGVCNSQRTGRIS